MEQIRKPMLYPITIAIFLGVVMGLVIAPSIWPFIFLIFLLLLLYKKRAYRSLVYGLLFSISLVNCYYHVNRLINMRVPPAYANHIAELTLEVIEPPKIYAHYQKAKVSVLGADVLKNLKGSTLWVYAASDIDIAQGSLISADARLKPPFGYQSKGAFNRRMYMFRQGIAGTASLTNIQQLEVNKGSVRPNFAELVITRSTKSPETAAWLKAVLLGDTSGFSYELKKQIRHSHIQHLLVVSGLHLATLFGLVYGLLGLCSGVCSPWINGILYRKFQLIICLSLAACYSAMCGFALPTTRALVMLSVPTLMLLLGRGGVVQYSLPVSLIGILTINPISILSPGLWLSYSAVAILIFGFFRRSVSSKKRSKVWHALFKPQWLIFLGLSPILLGLGLGFNAASFFLNLVLIPIFSLFIIPSAFCGFTLAIVGSNKLASLLWKPIGFTAEYLPEVLSYVTPYWADCRYSWVQILVVFTSAVIYLAPNSLPMRKLTWLSLLVLLIPMKKSFEEARLVFFDVGQGLSLFFQSREKTLIYDTGPAINAGLSAFEQVVLPWLAHQGIREIDYLIVSHADNDHAGGSSSALTRLKPATYIAGEPLDESRKAIRCKSGQDIVLGKWRGIFLNPEGLTGNDASCVLKLHLLSEPNSAVLLTGDISKKVEYWLIEQNSDELNSEILSVSHHGSATSSSSEFLAEVSARFAVVNSGPYNRFNHPDDGVVERLAKHSQILNTGYLGTLEFTFENGTWSPKSDSRSHLYWLTD